MEATLFYLDAGIIVTHVEDGDDNYTCECFKLNDEIIVVPNSIRKVNKIEKNKNIIIKDKKSLNEKERIEIILSALKRFISKYDEYK